MFSRQLKKKKLGEEITLSEWNTMVEAVHALTGARMREGIKVGGMFHTRVKRDDVGRVSLFKIVTLDVPNLEMACLKASWDGTDYVYESASYIVKANPNYANLTTYKVDKLIFAVLVDGGVWVSVFGKPIQFKEYV